MCIVKIVSIICDVKCPVCVIPCIYSLHSFIENTFEAHYLITDVLGSGSQGKVYRVQNRINGKHFAAKKVILPHDEKAKANVEREAHALHKLQHPHIVQMIPPIYVVKEGSFGKSFPFRRF